ncbi:MAG: apolipoprotein N-acyltransferase [Novosphingobium sp.]
MDPLASSAGRALSAVRIHHRLAAPVLGGVAACGFQPLALWPLTIVAIAALIELVARARSGRQAALLGWLFGVGHFTLGNNWIATAFTYQANMPAWLGWIAVVLLSFYLAVYPALAAAAAWNISRPGKAGRDLRLPDSPRFVGLVFAACWIVSEWLRGWVLTGFAWNPLGVALLGGYEAPGLARLAPFTGTYGLSGVLVGIAALVRTLCSSCLGSTGRGRVGALAGLIAGAALLTLAMVLPARAPRGAAGSLPFTLVQPDIRQEVLNEPDRYEQNFRRVAGLSIAAQPGELRLVLWPESAVPDYLRDGYPQPYYEGGTHAANPALARQRLAGIIGARGLLLAGAVDLVIRDGAVVGARNAVTAIDDRGAILAGYSKAHLVPFGEYLPLRLLLEPLGAARLVPGSLDFEAGPGPRTFDLGPWGRAGIQICYEIAFSGAVVDPRHRPDYIFNPSNDGWFGSWGSPQHLAQARLRAIEEGLPVLRSTTTGISAVIGPDGTVRQHLSRLTAGRLDGVVPYAAPPTPFARLGNALPLALAVLMLVISLVAMRRPTR